jgi:capsular exopolysaccharide synthesis family protein
LASFDEPDLDLRSFLGIFWRQKYLILVVALITTAAAGVYSLLQTPVYEASATVLVDLKVTSGQDPNESTNPIQATQQAIISEIQFAESDQVDDLAREDLEEKVDFSAEAGGGSALRFVVGDRDRDVAADGANAYADAYLQARGESLAEQVRASNAALRQRIATLQTSIDNQNARLAEISTTLAGQETPDPALQQEATQLQFRVNTDSQSQADLRGQLAQQQGQVQTLISGFGELTEQATPPSSPTSPDLTRDLILGFAAGLLLGFAIAFARHLLDDRARNRSRLESQTGAPTLATLPQFAGRRRAEAGVAMVDAFRGLRAALEFASLENPFQVLAVVSPVQGDGKTTVAANLAIALAQAGQRTIAVDLDLRGPSLHRALAVSPVPGWTSITVPADVQPTLQESAESPRLHVVAAGDGADDPADVLIPPRLEPIIADLKSRSDVVVLDTPAVLATTDAQVIVRESDAVLLVVSASTSRSEIEDTLRALERVGGKVVGTVLNRADIRVRRYEVEPGEPELPTPSRSSSRRSEPAPKAKADAKTATTTAPATTTTKAPPRKRASTRTNRST